MPRTLTRFPASPAVCARAGPGDHRPNYARPDRNDGCTCVPWCARWAMGPVPHTHTAPHDLSTHLSARSCSPLFKSWRSSLRCQPCWWYWLSSQLGTTACKTGTARRHVTARCVAMQLLVTARCSHHLVRPRFERCTARRVVVSFATVRTSRRNSERRAMCAVVRALPAFFAHQRAGAGQKHQRLVHGPHV